MSNILRVCISFGFIILLILFPDVAISSSKNAFDICINVLMPSLFPFFVLSNIFVSSRADVLLGKIFSPVMPFLFRINGSGAVAFILGAISGYPIGSKTAADLYNSGAISKSEANNLICFSNNSGPLFIIGAVGVGMMSSKSAGVFLYFVHILSAITMGILLRWNMPTPSKKVIYKAMAKQENIFTTAVESSLSSLIKVFGYVIFFGIIMDICESTNILKGENKFMAPLVSSVFELTTGIKKLNASDISFSLKLILSSFMLGWSGFSIHFQTKSVLDGFDFSFNKYVIAKFCQGLISAFYTYLGLKVISFEKSVFLQPVNFISSKNNCEIHLVFITAVIMLLYMFIVLRRLKYSRKY